MSSYCLIESHPIRSLLSFFDPQRPGCIQDGQQRYTYVGKYRHPHAGFAQRTQQQYQTLDTQRKGDILPHDSQPSLSLRM